MAFNFPRGLDSEAQDYTVFQRTAEQPQDDQHSYEDIKTRPECLSMTEWVLLLWSSLGSSLLFLEALGSSLFLPIIPALVRELGPEKSSASATAWVGLLVGAYYAGRSSVLAAASFKHGRRSSLADDLEVEDSVSLQEQMVRLQSPPRLLRACVALAFSVTMYVASGLTTVGRQHEAVKSIEGQLWRLAAFRLVGGALSAAHRILGRGCLNECTISSNSSHQTGLRTEVVASGEAHKLMHVASGGRLCGLVVGCAVAGALFSPGSARPIHLLGIAGAVAHLPSWVLLVLIWRSGRGGGGGRGQGGWSAISNSNGYDTVRGTPGGSDAEVELIERSAWSGGGADVSGSGKHGAMSGVPVESAGSGSEPGGVGDELAVPGRYLRGCKGDLEEAERRWRLTLEWRSRERIDEVLREPQPHFDVIKRHYPHFIHRRARNGCPVWIELPGRIDLPAIRSGGVTAEALQRHYVFVTEYLWGVVEPDFENGQAVTVLDVQGLGMRDLAGEALGFVKQATAIVQDHYVERSNRMFIINAPSYFSMIWRMIRPMLNERTQAKIGIINTDKKKIAAALLEVIAPENLPPQYGGTCTRDLGESEEEADLRAFVASITPSSDHELRGHDRADEGHAQVEVDLGRPVGSVGSAPDQAVPIARNNGMPESSTTFGGVKASSPQIGEVLSKNSTGQASPGAARRVVGRVGGALGWAGRKLAARRRPNVAHLGDENGFEYDAVQQRWVLRRDAVNTKGSGGGGASGTASRDGVRGVGQERTHLASLRPDREGSVGSSTSEEMTVLAIQAAHRSLESGGTKLFPMPSDVPIATAMRSGSAATQYTKETRDPVAEDKVNEADLVLPCLCLRRFKQGASPALGFSNVVYAISTATREAIPVWLLAAAHGGQGGDDGGMGATVSRVGFALAAGILTAEAGRTLAGATSSGHGQGQRLVRIVRGRLAIVATLGLLFLLWRVLAPSGVPSFLFWMAVTLAMAVNHASLEESASPCRFITPAKHGGHDGDRRGAHGARSHCRRPMQSPTALLMVRGRILLGDVLGSAGGPFLLALVLCTGWPSPFDASAWLVLSLGCDLWLSFASRAVEPQHTRLLSGGDDDCSDVEENGRGGGFANFV